MKTCALLLFSLFSLLTIALPAKPMWQPDFAVRVMVAFDESRGFEYVPLYDSLPLPGFPLMMRRANVGGDVDFQFTVLKDGSITDVVLRAKFPEFREAVATAIKTWRFHPLAENGPRFPDEMKLRGKVRFDLPEDVEVNFPYPGMPPPSKDIAADLTPLGITHELDEATGKRDYMHQQRNRAAAPRPAAPAARGSP